MKTRDFVKYAKEKKEKEILLDESAETISRKSGTSFYRFNITDSGENY